MRELQTVGPYQLLRPLGRGGMGIIRLAEHRESGRQVAVKTVRVVDPALLRTIRREIHALSRIAHPGVVRILEHGVDGGVPWYAMELIEGPSLRAVVESWWSDPSPHGPGASAAAGHLAAGGHLDDALRLCRDVCRTLAFLHGEGVLHGDLKPDNVLLGPGGAPVLVDFGLATRFAGPHGREAMREVIDSSGELAGSSGFVAPEQLRGDPLDARADLYSVGAILHWMLTGRLPGNAADRAVATPSAQVSGVPPAVDALVVQLLQADRRARTGYASDLAAALDALLSPSHTAAPGATALFDQATTAAPDARPYLYRAEFAGRTELLEGLRGSLQQARKRSGSLEVVLGESGAGKTRLALELANEARALGMQVQVGTVPPPAAMAQPGAGHLVPPLEPLRPLLQTLADLARSRGAKTAQALLGAETLLGLYEPSLRSVPGVAAVQPDGMSSQELRARVAEQVVHALRALARERPLLWVLDDLQWADELTREVLAALAASDVSTTAVMVLLLSRSDAPSAWLTQLGDRRPLRTRTLRPLSRDEVAAVARDMLANMAVPEEMVDVLAERTGGNPLFVAESLRVVVSQGLVGRDAVGRWSLPAPEIRGQPQVLKARIGVPATIRELMEQQLDGLAPPVREALNLAAVIGRELIPELLTGEDEAALLDALETLLRAGVLDETGQGTLQFRHDLFREVTYERLPADARRALHGIAAERISARGTGDGTGHAVLAHHLLMAGQLAQAVDAFEAAGEHALSIGANSAAVSAFEQAFSTAAKLEHGVPRARLARWKQKLGECHVGLEDPARIRTACTEALQLLGQQLPKTRLGWGTFATSQLLLQVGHLLRPRWWPHRGNENRDEGQIASAAASRLLEVFHLTEHGAALVAMALMSVNRAESAGQVSGLRRQYAQLGFIAGVARVRPLANRYFRLACAEVSDGSPRADLFTALWYEASYRLGAGEWARASEAAERAIDGLVKVGSPAEIGIARSLRAQVDFYRGNVEATLGAYQVIIDSAQARRAHLCTAWGLSGMARSLLELGRVVEARPLLEETLRLIEGGPDRSTELSAHALLGAVKLSGGDTAGAVTEAERALALARGRHPAAVAEDRAYEAMVQIFLAAPRSRETISAARESAALLRGCARMFPISGPVALRCEGLIEDRVGSPDRAVSLWKRGLRNAERLGIGIDREHLRGDLERVARIA